MESISDFWKSARERLTNPFAFAYVVAWFTYNWRISVALFFTNEYPNSQNAFDFIASELNVWMVDGWPFVRGLDIYLWPFFIAIFYIFLIAFFRQVVAELNVRFDKWGTGRWIKASGGGKVPVEKYFAEREKLEQQTKKLEQIFEQETKKDNNFMELERQYETLQSHLAISQKSVNELQSKLNQQNILATEGQRATVELATVKQRLTEMEGIYNEQLSLVEQSRDVTVFDGIWKVHCQDNLGTYEYDAAIYNGQYSTPSAIAKINHFFYDPRSKNMTFNKVATHADGQHLYFYRLKFENKVYVTGYENQYPITYTFIRPYDPSYRLKSYGPSRAIVTNNLMVG